jgi:branched-subunit amino acid ABC-type transport system permease component
MLDGLPASLFIVALPTLGVVAVIVTGGIRYPIHAMAAGLFIGALSSAVYSYLRYGEMEKFIAVALGGRPYTYFTFGLATYFVGWLILLAGIATGSLRWSRRRRLPRPRRH